MRRIVARCALCSAPAPCIASVRVKTTATICAALAFAAGYTVASASGAMHTRSCGVIEKGIGIFARATPNVSCAQARRVLPPVLLGSKQCYSGPARFHPCTIEGFYCTTSQISSGATRAHCIHGRRLITGTAGP